MDRNYQTSYTNSQGQMFVARADNFEEFKKRCDDLGIPYTNLKVEVSRYDNRAVTTEPSKYEGQRTHFCTIHNKDLKERNERDGVIWDHRMKINEVWNRCTGSGFVADKPRVYQHQYE